MKEEDKAEAAKKLIKIMRDAVVNDNQNNSGKKPALSKLLLLG